MAELQHGASEFFEIQQDVERSDSYPESEPESELSSFSSDGRGDRRIAEEVEIMTPGR